jgi:hypothetical protein
LREVAVIVTDWSHIELSYVVPFYSDGTDEAPVVDLLRRYADYPSHILDVTLFVLVDDGSPATVEIPTDLNLNLRVLRVGVDIPWNQPGARNLGAAMSVSDKIFMTDVDHVLNVEAFEEMIRRRNPGRTMYKLRRNDSSQTHLKSHPNTFFLSRARFLRYYGYDEEFCGHYGFDDAMLWRWQRYHGTRFLYLPSCCIATLREMKGEIGFHSLVRSLDHNRALATQKRAEWKRYGSKAGHSRKFLSFPWTMQSEKVREGMSSTPRSARLWVDTWWWRWLLPAR